MKEIKRDDFEFIENLVKDACRNMSYTTAAEADNILSRIEKILFDKKETKNDGKKLHLEACSDNLMIYYHKTIIGHIDNNGECHFMNNEKRYNAWKQWLINKNVDNAIVNWKGGKYTIDEFGYLMRIDIEMGVIYSFFDRLPISGCSDNNIHHWNIHRNRWKNGLPIVNHGDMEI